MPGEAVLPEEWGQWVLQTVGKVTRVLDLFSLEEPEWGVGEVARTLGYPKSSVSELMTSLADQRLLCRVGKGRYRLGWRLFELSQTLLQTTGFRGEARRVMEELVESWQETMHLAVLDGVQAVYIEKLQPTPAIKILLSWSGARLPAHCSGVGKVLLAHSPWDYVAANFRHMGLPKLTPNTITDLDELERELEVVRERGHAYDMEEASIGLSCVAAPIYDAEGRAMAAVSFSVPAFRFKPREEEFTEAILKAAGRISSAMPERGRIMADGLGVSCG